MKKFISFALAISFFVASARAENTESTIVPKEEVPQEEPREDPPLGVFTFLTKIPGDYAAVGRSLFSADTLSPFLMVVGSTAVLIQYDYETWQPFSKEHAKKKFFHDATEFGWNVGTGGFQFGIAGAFLLYGASFGNHRAMRTASQIVEVVIATGITTQVLKHITGRESPNVATDVRTGRWHWFPNPAKYSRRVSMYDAFPSGHIATTFATARVIESNYPEKAWIPFVSYPVIAFVGLSMVATNGHWWSDYPLSLLLGYHFAKAVTRGNTPYKPGDELAFRLDPYMPYPDSSGLMISKRF